MNEIEPLKRITEGEGPHAISRLPDQQEMFDKINEIIGWINSKKDQLL